MLPSKGYFKSLNCPYFQNGFCDRPHCHFRHTRKDKVADDNQQLEDVDQSTQIADILSDFAGETSSDSLWPASQSSPSTSVSYKPTPIVELKKRHIPVTTAPSVTLSSNSQKRRIEYDVKGIKKPKVEYIPEAVNSESNSSSVYPTDVTSTVYRATKICDHPDRSLNGGENPLLKDNEESEGEIDFDQVSNELNFLDEILKEYEKPISIKNLLNESNFNEVSAQKKEEQEQITNKSEVLSEKASNGFLKHSEIPPGENNRRCSSESDHIHSNEIKKHKDGDHKVKSSHNDSKNKTVNNCSKISEKSRQKGSTSSSTSGDKDENKRGSEPRRKSVDHHKSERDRSKNKGDSETLSCSSKSTKRESGSEFDKLLKSDSNKSSNSVKHSRKEHGSSSNKSSNKESDHKSSSSKSTRKDSERESSSNKSSVKESDRKNSSSKSYKKESDKKESDHQSKSSKSSKSEHHESSRKRTHSPESHSNSKKQKENSKAEHKQSDGRKSSKYKDEIRHRKESNEKRSTKEDKSLNSKECKRRETNNSPTGNREKRKRTHSVSESEVSSDDDVEIISEHESIIVIDSEEDTSSENSPSPTKSKVENVESSPSPAHSSGMASPTFPSDVSDASDIEYSAQDDQAAGLISVSNGPSRNTKAQDDASLLDHRVQSRIKNRVSLGSVWRPPARKKPVEIMTPAQRLLLFAKLREKEEKDNDSQSNAGRVKIGCVPNVKHLLEEKERLLKGSNQNIHPKDRRPNAIMRKPQVLIQQNQVEDKDAAPTAPLGTKHPRNKGADLFTRRAMLEKLYKCQKQLLEPNRLFKEARDKCLQDESKIWLATNHDTYEKEMQNLVMRRKSEIPDFTLRFFTSIRPKQSIMFPDELKKKPENGKTETSPSREESLYSWLLKYCLTEEQLESEGYPRKKIDSSRGRILAYINQESLNKWKKAQGIPPTGEYACSNCSKFYSVDDNGLSTNRWECRYHAKKAWRTLKDKSGLLEKKARCCGNGLDNPCMSSEYHSTETRDMQNLEGFVETKEPHGDMPMEGWGIFALDCEMYWSTRGVELGRVTVVNAEQRTVYDTFVKPEFPVTDYTTRMSGLTKENLKSARKTFAEVQTDLLKLFNSRTILIGHSLENDLKVLQIIHNVIVDTAIVFKNGEYKQALKILASDLLKEVIQNEEDGHDSAEDAVTCIRLMMQKIFKDAIALARRAPPAPRGRYRASNPGI